MLENGQINRSQSGHAQACFVGDFCASVAKLTHQPIAGTAKHPRDATHHRALACIMPGKNRAHAGICPFGEVGSISGAASMKLKTSLTFIAGFAACAALLFLTAATRSPHQGSCPNPSRTCTTPAPKISSRTRCGSLPWVPACRVLAQTGGGLLAGRAGQRRQVPLRPRVAAATSDIAAQKIPYDYLDKVFIGHLHVDHMGDLPTFWLGGTVMNRLTPLRIWGPSGATPEYGTKHALDLMRRCTSGTSEPARA